MNATRTHVLIIISLFMSINIHSNINVQKGIYKGAWVTYDKSVYVIQKWDYIDNDAINRLKSFNITIITLSNNETILSFTDRIYVVSLSINKVTGNKISFQIVNKFNDKIISIDNVTIDVSKLYNETPENIVHTFFIPPNLNYGDRVPTVSYLNNNITIDSTKDMMVNGIQRTINHYNYTSTNQYITDKGNFQTVLIEGNCYFDKETGIMIESHVNNINVVYDNISRISYVYMSKIDYKIKNTNMWYKQNNIYLFLFSICAFLLIVIIYLIYYLKKRGKVNCHYFM